MEPDTWEEALSACWIGLSVDGSPRRPRDISFFLSAERREAFQNETPSRSIRAAGRPYMNQRAIRIFKRVAPTMPLAGDFSTTTAGKFHCLAGHGAGMMAS